MQPKNAKKESGLKPLGASLLEIETMDATEWMDRFEKVDCSLSQALILVALIHDHGLIQQKESSQFKRFLLAQDDS